jgi:hypothetical protein
MLAAVPGNLTPWFSMTNLPLPLRSIVVSVTIGVLDSSADELEGEAVIEVPLEAVLDSPPAGAGVLVVGDALVCTVPKASVGVETGAGRVMLSNPATTGGIVNTTGGGVTGGGMTAGGVIAGGVTGGGAAGGGAAGGGAAGGGAAVKVSAVALPAAWVNR